MSNVSAVQFDGIINLGAEEDEVATKKSKSSPRFQINRLSSREHSKTHAIANNTLHSLNTEEALNRTNAYQGETPEKPSTFDKNALYDNNVNAIPTSENSTQPIGDLVYMTNEAVPMSAFYRNALSMENAADNFKRPTFDLLHKELGEKNGPQRNWDALQEHIGDDDIEQSSKSTAKLGWIKGVLLPNLLNIWGIILFIRIPMIAANAGIGLSTVIIALSTVVTVITALSMSAVSTNGEVKGGGPYYLISRSLGAKFGGSVGVILSLANAVAVSLNLVGLGETIVALMEESHVKIVGGTNDIRIISLILLVFVLIITVKGLDLVVYTQSVLLFLLLLAMAAAVVGAIIPAPEHTREWTVSHGVPGFSKKNFIDNFGPEYRDGKGFFDIFAVFFPAATGIMTGANLSGDLKDPSKAVPLGTLYAILITSVSYIFFCWVMGAATTREVAVHILLNNPNNTYQNTSSGFMNVSSTVSTTLTRYTNFTCDASVPTSDTRCVYGATRDMEIMEKISVWGPLVIIGIFAASLSSALASLVSAPKVFQAVCNDKLFPYIETFGKSYGKSGEPRNGYILAFFIAAGFIAIGQLDIIAPIISNFFLMAYAAVNYSVFQASLSKSPGWRPTFKFYNMWVAFFGFLLCIAIMFLINWWSALITIAVVAGLYRYVDIRKSDINWGSSGQAHTYLRALRLTRRLNDVEDHVKNYRVQVLCLSGKPSLRPNLVDFASHITKHYGLLVCGDVVITDDVSVENGQDESKWLKERKIKSFYQIIQDETLRRGVRCLLQSTGLGKLKPNTLLIGYKSRWQKAPMEEVDSYVGTILDAFKLKYGVGVLRLENGFEITADHGNDETIDEAVAYHKTESCTEDQDKEKSEYMQGKNVSAQENHVESAVPSIDIVQQFHRKRKGFIDVWWLYDDGGLTILVPHILSLSSYWRGCKLRIFTPASDQAIKANQIRMTNLLKKFRIDFSSVVEFHGINKHPSAESVHDFKKYRNGEHLSEGNLDAKTLRQIRLGELLREHSQEALLIVLTLPIPKKSVVSSFMYMSWLEVLSAHLPPVLLLRGNQDSVLTFYS